MGKKRSIGFIVLLTAALSFLCDALVQSEAPPPATLDFLESSEYVYENPDEGVWSYASPTLVIQINRHYDAEKNLTWTEADILVQNGEHFSMTPKDPENRMQGLDYVPEIAQENGIVFATSSDYAHLRIKQRAVVGIIIRDGEIISAKSRKSISKNLPNLDTLALFPDGDMKVFGFKEHAAQEYLDMGVTDVLAFGPILIRDGVTNEAAIAKYGIYKEPRLGIGMLEKGHYLVIMVEGRHSKSKGITIRGLADMFAERGCTLAFNLDGGQTATMAFMGKQIIRVGKFKSDTAPARTTAEVLGIGYSQALQQQEPSQ